MLISCPECGKHISDKAKSCPECGYTLVDKIFCKYCGEKNDVDCVVCTSCGKQIKEIRTYNEQIVINNNSNAVANATIYEGRKKDKWIAFFLCLFLGFFGAHKFYEGKTGIAILYLFTMGLCGIGWIIDCIILLFKPNPYYV